MALTLAQLEAKRDEILLEIETASIRTSDGSEKQYVVDKRAALEIINQQIRALTAKPLRRTVISTSKGL